MTSHFLWASRTTPLHKQGQELRSEQTVPPLHEQSPATYFLRLNNLETFVELVGATPLHLLLQTALPLKSPTEAFIAPLRFANAIPPQTLLRTDEEELCQFDTIPPTIEKTERSRRGTPCCTYRSCLWIFRVRSFRAHPVFVLRKNLRNKS